MDEISRAKNVRVRRARIEDGAAIAGLLGELGYPNTTRFARGKIKKILSGKNDCLFVIDRRGNVVGFVSCHIVPMIHQTGNLCRVTALVVAKEHHGEGLGFELMNRVEQYARGKRCLKIEITSGERRIWTHDFYRKMGYQDTSKRFLKSLVK